MRLTLTLLYLLIGFITWSLVALVWLDLIALVVLPVMWTFSLADWPFTQLILGAVCLLPILAVVSHVWISMMEDFVKPDI